MPVVLPSQMITKKGSFIKHLVMLHLTVYWKGGVRRTLTSFFLRHFELHNRLSICIFMPISYSVQFYCIIHSLMLKSDGISHSAPISDIIKRNAQNTVIISEALRGKTDLKLKIVAFFLGRVE